MFAACRPFKGMASYCASKAAVTLLSRTIALEEGLKVYIYYSAWEKKIKFTPFETTPIIIRVSVATV